MQTLPCQESKHCTETVDWDVTVAARRGLIGSDSWGSSVGV